MTGLLYYPLGFQSLLQFQNNINGQIIQVPFFVLAELLINEIQQRKTVKLTVTGNLPVKICELLFNQQLIQWDYVKYVKKIREDDIPYIWPLKSYLLDMGIVKKRNNALSLTKNGEKMLKWPAEERFKHVFTWLASRFHWGNWYYINDNGESGQRGWAYSLMLLSKYGDVARNSEFYSSKLMQAFNKDLWEDVQEGIGGDAARTWHRAYEARFFSNFATWMGLVEIAYVKDPNVSYRNQAIVKKTALFDLLFIRFG